MENIKNYSRLVGRKLSGLPGVDCDNMPLNKVYEIFEYDGGNKTDKVIGFGYEVVEPIYFEKIKVKVLGETKPLITNEELRELKANGKNVFVGFKNLTIMAYINNERAAIYDSVKADEVYLAE